ncbi:PIN domain-containing protein [archaeon]|nr:PIN domain-containing protein [archaeon]
MRENLFLLDTNILVYAYDNTEDRKNEIALEIIEDCFGRGGMFALCLQNICEFLCVVTKKMQNKMSPEEAEFLVKDITDFKNFKKIHYKIKTTLKAAHLTQKYGLHYWDALIAATMIENEIYDIYTENTKDFSKIPGINAVNPFE